MASIRERTTRTGEQTWAVLWRHGKRQTSMTFSTAKAAADFRSLVDILGPEKALLTLHGEQENAVTVADLAEQFLTWKARDVTERTMVDYRRDYENWVKPWLGHRNADTVDEGDVQKWVDHMATTLAPKSVADRHMLLHSMYAFGKARSRRLVSHNPCLETDLPKRTKKPPKGTTVAEFQAILAVAGRRNPDARDLILFLGSTGWRWSEAAALAVRDVEDDGETLHCTVSRVFRLDSSSRQVITEDAAKTYAAFRRVEVAGAAAAMVRMRMVGKGPGDLLFTNSRGTQWSQNTFLRETWPRIVADADLGAGRKPTPHWLRHMAVAVMAASGATMPEIQRYIGHERISTTIDVYGGMIGSVSGPALAAMDDILMGRRSVTGVSGDVVRGELA